MAYRRHTHSFRLQAAFAFAALFLWQHFHINRVLLLQKLCGSLHLLRCDFALSAADFCFIAIRKANVVQRSHQAGAAAHIVVAVNFAGLLQAFGALQFAF